MKLKVVIFAVIACLLFSTAAWAESQDLLSLENKYIKVFINNTAEETGRFAVDVTGGDPGRADDNNKPLIYGHPKPWTSFTTLQIDGVNYVFGKGTNKRSGAGLPGGEIVDLPAITDNRISMKCNYGPVEVEQFLDITRSPSTGALDTSRIKYTIKNNGSTVSEIGLRVLLDAMVGDNDGAPFRVGDKEIKTDYSCNSNESPDFWQAFDSLSHPAVIAQGTLKGGDVTTPDRILFTNWGKAADNPWDVPVRPGADFTRDGEDELDSAVVMYWNPRKLKAGEQFNIVIYYGLGGITFSPGQTYLGISAPAEIQYSETNNRSYTVMLYMEHRGEAKAENVKINLELPKGLVCSSGKSSITLPELIPGVTKQFSWEIRPNGLFQGDTLFRIRVTGKHLESNVVNRKIRIVGPPVLTVSLNAPALNVIDNHWSPYPAGITVRIKNSGESPAYNLKATLTSDSGVKLAPGERAEKYLLDLESQAETGVTWQVVPTGDFKMGEFKVVISGNEIKPVTVDGRLEVPLLAANLNFSTPEQIVAGRVVYVDLFAHNLPKAVKFSLNVKYNPAQLRLVYISRGTFLVEGDKLSQWDSGTIDNQSGTAMQINGSRVQPYDGNEATLIRLNFLVTGTGEGGIDLDNLKVYDANGNEITCTFSTYKYQIKEEEK
ncbi:MAG: hypothetical protein ACM3X9_12220 [Bacillota bacterium]